MNDVENANIRLRIFEALVKEGDIKSFQNDLSDRIKKIENIILDKV